MSVRALTEIRKAVSNLNPKTIRELSDRDMNIALYAATPDDYQAIEEYLLAGLSPARRQIGSRALHRGPNPTGGVHYDFAIYDESVLAPRRAFVFRRDRPESLVHEVLSEHDADLGIALSRAFPPFRDQFVTDVIRRTCRENAFFSLATALPDIVPTIIELPWAVTEFASDTAVLTMNQIRMAFLIAAASDREVGYRQQKSEIASVIGSAFGWRALARQVVGKIPFGGGLLPKAGIAYAATKLVGLSLDRFYRLGYGYDRQQREELYTKAFEQGKSVAARILKSLRPDLWEKFVPKAGAHEEQFESKLG
jgi:hypothetical protein